MECLVLRISGRRPANWLWLGLFFVVQNHQKTQKHT